MIKKYFLAATGAGVLFTLTHLFLTRENVFIHELSPDKIYSIDLIRRRIFPYVQGVKVEVRIINQRSSLANRQELADLDEWNDPLMYFKEINWSNSSVIVLPGIDDPVKLSLP